MPEAGELSIAGIGCTTRDSVITASPADINAFLLTQPEGASVQFGLSGEQRAAYRRFGTEHGHHHWTPGGTVPNTLCAAASARTAHNLPLAAIGWRGPAEYDDAVLSEIGLAHMRGWGIEIQPDYRPGFTREAFCLIDSETGEVHRIAIYEGEAQVTGQPHWVPCDLLIMTVHDLMAADAALLDYAGRCRQVALLIADWRPADGAGGLRQRLAQVTNLEFMVGRRHDYVEMGLCDRETQRFDALLANVECVGTDGPEPVLWKGKAAAGVGRLELDLPDPSSLQHVLGAGDGYAGAFLACRTAGMSAADAHKVAQSHAQSVMRTDGSYVRQSDDLNRVFPARISRQSASAGEGLFSKRLHSSPGLVVTCCGQTGIDQLALHAARSLGLTSFAIMPEGRRNESTELGIGGPDRLEGATVLTLATPSYRFCTWANVYASDGTILLDYARSEGSEETRKAAAWLGRPLIELQGVPVADIAQTLTEWIHRYGVRVVNCAGTRMSLLGEAAGEAGNALQRALLVAAAAVARRDCGIRTLPSNAAHETHQSGTEMIVAAPNSAVMRHLFRTFFHDAHCADDVQSFTPGQLTWRVPSLALQIVFARARDLPMMLRRGWAGYAIFGQDVLLEDGTGIEPIVPLGIDPCCLVEVTRNEQEIPHDRRAVWASAWPNLARSILAQDGREDVDVVHVTGCVEAWLRTGAIDSGIDTYQTGRAVEDNGLRVARFLRTVHVWIHRRADSPPFHHPMVSAFVRWLHGSGQAAVSEYTPPPSS